MNSDDKTFYSDIPFQAIVEQSLAGIYIIQDEKFMYVNETWAKMAGYTPEEMIGQNMRPYIHPDILNEVMDRYYKRINRELKSVHFITKAISKSGSIVRIEVHGSYVEYQGKPAVAGIGIDVTERLERDEELKRSKAQLQELAAHIDKIREEQRGKFARELHDVLGGMLTSMKMDVTRIMRRVNTPELQEITRGLRVLTQETIDTVRKISEELRPSVLDHLGLQAAIEKDIAEFSKRYSIKCHVTQDDGIKDLAPRKITATYRIFQEALTNIARHADASVVTVSLSCDGEDFSMEIIDNGIGIDLRTSRIGSIGVLSMKERARAIGGTLEVGPGQTCGTRLSLIAPMN